MKLSIIIPVFNEEKTIMSVLERIDTLSLANVTKEIIVVNDGSSDTTQIQINNYKLKNKKNNLHIVKHKENYGKGMAVKTGIKYATGDYVLIQDADAEYDPQDIVRLLQPIKTRKAQVVYGTRLKRLPHFTLEEKSFQFFLHYLGNKVLSLLASVLYRQWITDMETGYKVFPLKAVSALNLQAKGFEFEPEITAKFAKAGYKIFEIPITTSPRSYSEGKKLKTIPDGIKTLSTLIRYRFIN